MPFIINCYFLYIHIHCIYAIHAYNMCNTTCSVCIMLLLYFEANNSVLDNQSVCSSPGKTVSPTPSILQLPVVLCVFKASWTQTFHFMSNYSNSLCFPFSTCLNVVVLGHCVKFIHKHFIVVVIV